MSEATPYQPQVPQTDLTSTVWATLEPKTERTEQLMHFIVLGQIIGSLPPQFEFAKRSMFGQLEAIRHLTIGLIKPEETPVCEQIVKSIHEFIHNKAKEQQLAKLREIILPPGFKKN